MRNSFIGIGILVILLLVPALVVGLGEVGGPVAIPVQVGGTGTGSWGIFNNESITVKLSAQGDAAKFISLPDSVTLLPNNQITWINVTATVPSDYDFSKGTNITGILYALAEGGPGQVQINLQAKKNVLIFVGESSSSTLNIPQTSATTNSVPNQQSQGLTGMFSLGSLTGMLLTGMAMIVLVALIIIVKIIRR